MATVDSASAQHALDLLMAALGLAERECDGRATIRGTDPVLASRHRFGELMAAAQAALGLTLGQLWVARGGKAQDVSTTVVGGVHQHHGIAFMRQNGRKLPFTDYGPTTGVDDPLTGEFYPTRDGRFMKLEMFYPRLRDAVFEVLSCSPSREAVEAAVMAWDGEALERAIREEGGAVGMVRSAAQWRAHPVGRRLAGKPVVEIEKIGDSEPIPLPEGADMPLGGARVLDCTHVIGGRITTTASRARSGRRTERGRRRGRARAGSRA